MTDGLLEITLEDDDAVEMTTDSGFVKIGTITTGYSASVVEEIIVHGGPGDNEIDLGAVNDLAFTSLTSVSILGGAGNDSITGSGLVDLIGGAWGDDTLSGNEGNDLLLGGAGDDSLGGGLGDDIYAFEASGNGSDIIVEQAAQGRDWLEFSASQSPLVLRLDDANEQFWGGGSISLVDPSAIENVVGTSANDMLSGNDADNLLLGGDGDDTMVGLAGNDVISGDYGDDAIVGGDGKDISIAGEGSDFAAGDFGDDLVFAADLAFPDVTMETLQDVQGTIDVLLGAWTANLSVSQRLANLTGAAGASNRIAQPYQLQPGETVLNDDDIDLLPATLNDDVVFLDSGRDLPVLFPENSPIFREVDPTFEAIVSEFEDGTLTVSYRGDGDVVYSLEDGFVKVNGADPLATPLATGDVIHVMTQLGRLAGEINDSALYGGTLANLQTVAFTRGGAVVMPEMTAEIVDGIFDEHIGPDWTTQVEESAEEIADTYNSGRYGILFEILCAAGAGAGQSLMQSSQGTEPPGDSDLLTDLAFGEGFPSGGRDTWWRKSKGGDTGDDPVKESVATASWWNWWQQWQGGAYALSSMGGGESSMLSGDGGEGGTLTIEDAEPVNEGVAAYFKLTLDAKYHNGFTFDYETVNGSAIGGGNFLNGDYAATDTTFTWMDGGEGSNGGISIVTFPDYRVEGNETFQIVLSNLVNADGAEGDVTLGNMTATATIKNTSTYPKASAGWSYGVEGEPLSIAIVLDDPHQETVTVNWQAVDITTDGGADFSPLSGTVTFAAWTESTPGETIKYIEIATNDDSVAEYDEQFYIEPTGGTNVIAFFDPEQMTPSTILDNDPNPLLTVEDVTVTEGGSATFTLTLDAASEKIITVTVSTSIGTAGDIIDYSPLTSTQYTIDPGTTTREVTIQTLNDSIPEPTEFFSLNVTNGSGVRFPDGLPATSAKGNIEDNDPLEPVVAIVDFDGDGNQTILVDPGDTDETAPFGEYGALHWLDLNLDHDGKDVRSDGLHEHEYPVAYKRASTPVVFVAIETYHMEYTGPFRIKGSGGWNVDFESTVATVQQQFNGRHRYMTLIAATNPLPDEVSYLQQWTINWSFSPDDGATWIDAGSSKNQAYLTYDTPRPNAPVYHTVIHTGSANAVGATTEQATFDGLWSAFDDTSLTNHKGQPLHYWKNWSEERFTTETLLADHDGRCGAWADFMADVMAVQGIGGTHILVTPDDDEGFIDGFFINNWTAIPGTASPYWLSSRWNGTEYTYVKTKNDGYDAYDFGYAQLQDAPAGIPGQNNNDPQAIFNNHALIFYGGKYYDPSYGAVWDDQAHFDTCVFGYYHVDQLNPGTIVDETGLGEDVNGDGVIGEFATLGPDFEVFWVYANPPGNQIAFWNAGSF